ncbi:hypothetical protein QR680_012072 [Steinernema hermaphroditum]|uniref:Uncharacterized protein n=1 Tax=Steinernema hermaphroditum TaxID=289476 RepID=A0AA39I0T5_9BILA|nr:hypothetical protein QR680_012072 [Steinernema hermaphroditum]
MDGLQTLQQGQFNGLFEWRAVEMLCFLCGSFCPAFLVTIVLTTCLRTQKPKAKPGHLPEFDDPKAADVDTLYEVYSVEMFPEKNTLLSSHSATDELKCATTV